MKKKLLFLMLLIIGLINVGCGKRQEISNMKLVKVMKMEKAPIEESKEIKDDEKNNYFEDLFTVVTKKKEDSYIKTEEIEIKEGNVFEDEIMKIDFTIKEDKIVSNIVNKMDKFFYIVWSKNNIYMNNYKENKKLIRLELPLDTVRYIQKDEVINKNQTKKIEYTSQTNVKTLTRSTASDATNDYWVSGKLVENETNFVEINFIIELGKEEYKNYIFRFEK